MDQKETSPKPLIAVFCRYERDYSDLELFPRKAFKRIRSVRDVSGITFAGAIRIHDWYRADREILDAEEMLRSHQPELFNQ